MRRLRSRSSGKEPFIWDRTFTSMAVSQAAPLAGASIFSPVAIGGAFDQTFTLRRLKLVIQGAQATTVVGGSLFHVYRFGIYLGGVGEPTRDPALATAADQSVDWLALWSDVALTTVANTLTQQSVQTPSWVHDIKTQRRVNFDQEIVLAVSQQGFPAVSATTWTTTFQWTVSNLFTRSLRK